MPTMPASEALRAVKSQAWTYTFRLQVEHLLVHQQHALHVRGSHVSLPLRATLAAPATPTASSISTQSPCAADM
jgi:hypothetical protein